MKDSMHCWHPGLMTGKRLPQYRLLLKSMRMGRSRWQSLLQSLLLVCLLTNPHIFTAMWCSLFNLHLRVEGEGVTFQTCAPSHYLLYFLGTCVNPRNHHAHHPFSQAFSTCTTSDTCHCSKQLLQHYPASRLGVNQFLLWLLQKGHQSRMGLPQWPVLNRAALLAKTSRYALQRRQAVPQLSADWVHDQQHFLLPPPMQCLSPKPEMLLFKSPLPLSACPGCRYKHVPAGRCTAHQHISGKPIASACD